MAWSYISPLANDKDKVRFLVGDTNTSDQLVTDEEIEWALTNDTIYSAAATVAESIGSKFARKADKTVDDLSISYSQISKAYMDKAKELRSKSNRRSFVSPYLGGISQSEKESSRDDDDLIQPEFRKDMFDNPTTDNDKDCLS